MPLGLLCLAENCLQGPLCFHFYEHFLVFSGHVGFLSVFVRTYDHGLYYGDNSLMMPRRSTCNEAISRVYDAQSYSVTWRHAASHDVIRRLLPRTLGLRVLSTNVMECTFQLLFVKRLYQRDSTLSSAFESYWFSTTPRTATLTSAWSALGIRPTDLPNVIRYFSTVRCISYIFPFMARLWALALQMVGFVDPGRR